MSLKQYCVDLPPCLSVDPKKYRLFESIRAHLVTTASLSSACLLFYQKTPVELSCSNSDLTLFTSPVLRLLKTRHLKHQMHWVCRQHLHINKMLCIYICTKSLFDICSCSMVWTLMVVVSERFALAGAGEADTIPPAIFFKRAACKDAHYV